MEGRAEATCCQRDQDLPTRDRLMHAAAELFSRKGYAATSVREIVTAVGVSKPVLYYYFKNKEGIYHEIIRDGLERLNGLIEEIRTMDNPVSEKILQLFTGTIELIREDIQIIRLMYAVQYGICRALPAVNLVDIQNCFDEAVLDLVKQGLDCGEFVPNDSEMMRWILVGALSISIDMMIFRPELGGGRDSLGRMVTMILRGFAAAGGVEKD
ncbi:MAG TPA: TetR/AcrR family transcriptional regulator [Syntrophales bacterium]|nr:TetR/AcrR family transcriptional regulator [Syntrophales bacterium]